VIEKIEQVVKEIDLAKFTLRLARERGIASENTVAVTAYLLENWNKRIKEALIEEIKKL
jgi:hypothetical protein